MKSISMWIIRVALAVQFVSVLAIPALLAGNEAPRGMWMAEWVRPHAIERTIGVLKLREGKVTFVEQIGQVDWELDLSRVRKVSAVNGGRAMVIVSTTGEEYVVSIMEANLTQSSAKRVVSAIEKALESLAANSR